MKKQSAKMELLYKVNELMNVMHGGSPVLKQYADGLGHYIQKGDLYRLRQYHIYLEIEREILLSKWEEDVKVFDEHYGRLLELINEGIELVTNEQYNGKKPPLIKVV